MCFGGGGKQPEAPVNRPAHLPEDAWLDVKPNAADAEKASKANTNSPQAQPTAAYGGNVGSDYSNLNI